MSEAKVASLVVPVKSSPGLHYKNPRFPLNIKLPDNLECGSKIYVHGVSPVDANRFSLNLKNAEKDAHIYFHCNPRFDEGVIVRNSRLDEAWGDEEREGDFPFIPGEPFLMSITAGVDAYEIEVNGAPCVSYNHREGMSLCDVTHITMGGDVTVYGIHIPLATMPMPLVLRIPKNTVLGDTIIVEGDVPDGADRFALNLQCGADENADIMYHFNPRFCDDALVCNNRCADSWGDEERLDSLPIKPGDHFILNIVAAQEAYLPFINGIPLPAFPHRLDMSAACSICINGDVTVQTLTVDCPPVRLPPQVPDINLEEFENKAVQAFYPTNPVILNLSNGFGVGNVVHVSGKIDSEATRLKVNLQCGDSEDSEIALHFNPRWDSDEGPVLVLNSLHSGEWGEEVRENNPMPAGSNVEIHIIPKEDGYDILLDGDIVTSFPHRLEVGSVTHVVVDGCIAVNRIMAA